VEFILVFFIGFFSYWFLTKENLLQKTQRYCPSKETIMNFTRHCNITSYKLRKELKRFSLLKIQEGHYEYEAVLQTLIQKDKK
jgi:hypothetical protein